MAGSPDTSKLLFQRLATRLRLRHLQLLVAITEHGSLHAAAEHIGMTQPSATHAIGEIERLLDVELFERHNRGVRPNAFGLLLTDYAHASLNGLQRAAANLEAMRQASAVILRIGAIEAAARFLCHALPIFNTRHPGVHLQITEDGNRTLLPRLVSGQVDLVLGRALRDAPQNIEQTPLLSDRAVLVANPRHPLADTRELSLQRLYAYPWVVAPEGTESHGLFQQLVEAHGTPTLDPLSTTSMPLLAELLKDRRRIALLPHSLASKLMGWGLVNMLNIDLHAGMMPAMPPITLCRNLNNRSEPLARLYTELLEAAHDFDTGIAPAFQNARIKSAAARGPVISCSARSQR